VAEALSLKCHAGYGFVNAGPGWMLVAIASIPILKI
jgi:hypothetical protein